jgi:hypothetical protein
VGAWLAKSHQEKGIKPDYLLSHNTDGASNAIKSAQVFELQTEMARSTSLSHDTCHAHQNNRAAKYASGTGDFAINTNPELSKVLNKSHAILGRIVRSEKRLQILNDVQKRAGRLVMNKPQLGVVTRWNSEAMEASLANVFMGDLNKALGEMLGAGGMDEALLKDAPHDRHIDKKELMYTPEDQMIMRQYECGSEPCSKLSKFFQIKTATSHEVLFHIRVHLAEMSSPTFKMFADISHSDLVDLRKRVKTETVLSSNIHEVEDNAGRTEPMSKCIERFRVKYVENMNFRCGLVDENGSDIVALPPDIAISCLLHPLFGGMRRMEAAGLMTPEQYNHARTSLISRIQKMRETQSGVVVVIDSSSNDDDEMDDVIERTSSSEEEKASQEFTLYCNVVKKAKYYPKEYQGETMKLGDCIETGQVKTRGDDIKAGGGAFETCNLADYIDKKGHFDLVGFLQLQKQAFPYLFKLAKGLASLRTNEVGCERFFSTAGYVSSNRRTTLKVRNYECLATLRRNMMQVFIDEGWVVRQYLQLEETRGWDELESRNDIRVLELEREILAESLDVDVSTLPPINDDENEEQLTA